MILPLPVRLGLALAVAAASGVAAPLQGEVKEAYRHLAELRTGEALQAFHRLAEEGGADAEQVQLGLALTELAAQPRTGGRLDRAAERLRLLAESAADPEVALSARYHLVRLQDWRSDPGASVEATYEAFRRLYEEHPSSDYGQMAAIRAAQLDLFVRSAGERAVRDAIDRWARVGAAFKDPGLRSSLEMVLGDAAADLLADDRLSREHLVKVEELNTGTTQTLRRVRVRLIMLAHALGETEEVRQRLEAFRRLHPHEPVLPQMRALIQTGGQK